MFDLMSGQVPGPAMLNGLVHQIGPTPEEMEAERQRVLYRKHVEFKDHHVRVFDMHDAKQVREYEKLFKILAMGLQARTHYLHENELKLIDSKNGMRWHRYLEWSEFELHREETAPIRRSKD